MSHELTFDGVAVCNTYGLVLTEYEETPPEPKVYMIDVPYGTDIDISDSVYGVAFNQRHHAIGLFYTGGTNQNDFEAKAAQIYNALDGKRADYTLSWDTWTDSATPPVTHNYTYTGRVKVTKAEFMGYGSGLITLDITSDPYKLKEHVSDTYTFKTTQAVTLQGGRKAVIPKVTTDGTIQIAFGQQTVTLGAGKWNVEGMVVDGQLPVYIYATDNGTANTLNDYSANTLNDLKSNTLASLYTTVSVVSEDRTVTFEYDWKEL